MKVKIYPSKVNGTVTIPPSKSMSHRAIICASLANGTSTITNVAYSDDIKITIEGMRQLGANITCFEDRIIIRGIKDFSTLREDTIFCNESGSTLRFFIPIFSLCDRMVSFTGKNRLLKRPQKIYETLFREQNIFYEHSEEKLTIGGKLHAGSITLDGDVSSQFISGLLFALPLLEADSTIHIKEPYESRSYVDLTLQMLHLYGIKADYCDANTLVIPGNQQYKAHDYEIEGDYSQCGFFAVLGAINHDIICHGLSPTSLQGDRIIIPILKNSGASISNQEKGFRITKSNLHATEIDLQDCPDLGPILTVMAMYTKGKTRIYNAQRLRYKESDRIAAMEEELKKLGVLIHTTESEIFIEGKERYTGNVLLSGHKDHRIVMSLCIAATLFEHPVIIEEAQSINKSYPAFFEDLSSLGVSLEIIYD